MMVAPRHSRYVLLDNQKRCVHVIQYPRLSFHKFMSIDPRPNLQAENTFIYSHQLPTGPSPSPSLPFLYRSRSDVLLVDDLQPHLFQHVFTQDGLALKIEAGDVQKLGLWIVDWFLRNMGSKCNDTEILRRLQRYAAGARYIRHGQLIVSKERKHRFFEKKIQKKKENTLIVESTSKNQD